MESRETNHTCATKRAGSYQPLTILLSQSERNPFEMRKTYLFKNRNSNMKYKKFCVAINIHYFCCNNLGRKLFKMINTFQNCSVRQLFCLVTLSSYHGPVTYDKRLLMHQCDIETLIHCTGKWRFRSAQHRYVAASFWIVYVIVRLQLASYSPEPLKRDFLDFFITLVNTVFICRPSDSTVSEDAWIEPRTVATTALAVRRSNPSIFAARI
jgi:hypothetical protein